MAAKVLSDRALNRATLARQLLLERSWLATRHAVEHLVGLQGQAPLAPYVGLWTRLAGFAAEDLAAPLANGRLVRLTLLRGTVHLVTGDDAQALRPLVAPVLDRWWKSSEFARALAGLDVDEVLAAGRELLDAEGPLTRPQLGAALAARWPDRDPTSLAYAVAGLVPAAQLPPRGIWGQSGPPTYVRLEELLGPAEAPATMEDLVLRYLAAFGPASVRDCQAWCGLTGLSSPFGQLASRLLSFRDERGVELFDLPDAPRPDAETPAPVRFLPEYDNVLLSHADRRRVIPTGQRVPLPPGNGATAGTVLVDGTWRATWRRRGGQLTVVALGPLTDAEADEVTTEGRALLAFVAPGEEHDVRLSLARSSD